jgi:hypothetical protein
MKGAEYAITIIILLVLGVIALLVVVGMVSGSTGQVKYIANENDMYSCCRKYLPDCNEPSMICSNDVKDASGNPMTISELASSLNVDQNKFCGCSN